MTRSLPSNRFMATARLVQQITTVPIVPLNFTGYTDTLEAYRRVLPTEIDELFQLSKSFLLWSLYFEELRATIRLTLDQLILVKETLESTLPARRTKKDTEVTKEIQRLTTEVKLFKQLDNQLKGQARFFFHGHFYLKRSYTHAIASYQKTS